MPTGRTRRRLPKPDRVMQRVLASNRTIDVARVITAAARRTLANYPSDSPKGN
jgi:hypothetical protein